ncbi:MULTISPECIES: hypothetical protein [Sphingobium]|uniref:hypothetical protein n=1 Tax=Sphingobium TaxID=165695 RepID=UPI00242A524E|nr:hypothetical protein [Sphingobium yanoikuyae]
MTTKNLKADISLAERRRIEREQQAEIRAMLAPRHFATMMEQMAIDATLARLEREALLEAAPAIYAIMGHTEQVTVPVPAPVVSLEPASAAQSLPVPVASRPAPPDGLRQRLGLQ